MKDWKNEDKEHFLRHWFLSRRHRKGMRRMFDLHCENKDPWTWDYQWVYSCLKSGGLSVMPSKNLVSNIGIGPDGTNTVTPNKVSMFPEKIDQAARPLAHPEVSRDLDFEKRYYSLDRPPLLGSLKNYLKSMIRMNSLS